MSNDPSPSNQSSSTPSPSTDESSSDATTAASEGTVEETAGAVKSAEQPPTAPEPSMGWTAYAEQINGRFAMLGFLLLLLLEFFTHQDVFTWLGLR